MTGGASPWLPPQEDLPLGGVRVVDLSRVLAGPLCTMLLADLGADVLHVEAPGGSDDTHAWKPPEIAGESVYYLGLHRNKRSIELDLRTDSDRAVLEALLAEADVLVENLRGASLGRLGLTWDKLHARFPRLIHAHLTGFGSTGPYADLPGYDAIIQAMSGFMHVTGEPGRPGQKVGVAVTDVLSGLFLASGIQAALVERSRTGRGRYVEVALFEAALAGLANLATNWVMAGVSPERVGNAHPSIAPYGTFRAADGEIMVACGNDRQFARLCEVLGVPALAHDPRFATNAARVAARAALTEALERRLGERPVAAWVAALREADIPVGPVQDLPGAFSEPQVAARGMVASVESSAFGPLSMVACPIWTEEGRLPIRLPPPRVGEHTASVRRALSGRAPPAPSRTDEPTQTQGGE